MYVAILHILKKLVTKKWEELKDYYLYPNNRHMDDHYKIAVASFSPNLKIFELLFRDPLMFEKQLFTSTIGEIFRTFFRFNQCRILRDYFS